MTDANNALLCAAVFMDWGQVVCNGGPPCFHYEPERRRFCGRAERWAGHGSDHSFVPLRDLLELVERNAVNGNGGA